MPGYRRFVAYVYEYRKGKKADNCGYVRVEDRNARCRIEVHLRCAGLASGLECKVYGFVRKQGELQGILLGICETGEGKADCELETDSKNLRGSGKTLKELGGMALLLEGGGFYGTEWDDEPIRPGDFVEVQPESTLVSQQPGEKMENSDNKSQDKSEESALIKEEPKKSEEAVLTAEKAKESEKAALTAEKAKESEEAASTAEEPKKSEEAASTAEEPKKSGEAASTTEKPKENKEAVLTAEKPKEGEEAALTAEEQKKTEELAKNSADQKGEENYPDTRIQEVSENPDNSQEEEFSVIRKNFAENKMSQDPGMEMSRRIPQSDRNSAANGLHNSMDTNTRTPECDPFQDGEITQCRKIQIKDMTNFNRRDWALRNNRFLLYGYYQFGHLLLGRLRDGQYILGVPGMYDQQERFMANMFGFPHFKHSPQVEILQGKGGYWYRLIYPPNFNNGNGFS